MQSNSVAFEDLYQKFITVNDDLMAGKIDPSVGLAVAANGMALSKNMANEIKLISIDMAAGKTPPAFGKRLIVAPKVEERPTIEGESVAVDVEAITSIAAISQEKKIERKNRLPRIGIVGMSPVQIGQISQMLSGMADLESWYDEGDEKLRQMAKCDVIFINKSQISHKSVGILDSVKANYRMSGSGTTAMKEMIKRYFEQALGEK